MDSTLNGSRKDIWDKVSASSAIVAAILVPVAVAFVGAQYSSALKQRELDVTSKREYVQIGLSILRDPNTSDNLRKWAASIINHYSDVPMPDDTLKAFTQQGQILPPAQQAITALGTGISTSVADTGKVARIGSLQTKGINALLNKDIKEATQAYDTAYDLWPTFRNVDEIRGLLNSTTPPSTNQDWKSLYEKIAHFDLRGVDQNTLEQLHQKSQ